MTSHYSHKLGGRRLERCYQIAPPRVWQYLEVEIVHAGGQIGIHLSGVRLAVFAQAPHGGSKLRRE